MNGIFLGTVGYVWDVLMGMIGYFRIVILE
jgi:hypothetical protein